MPITEETVTVYKCSDGSTHTDKLDAQIHEADVTIKALCNVHGYSGMDREALYSFIRENAEELYMALYKLFLAVRQRDDLRAKGGQGALAKAHTGPVDTNVSVGGRS